jgi:hypothetical protein
MTATTTTTPAPAAAPEPALPLARLHAMRAGYLMMGIGLAVVKWPQLADVHSRPLYEGVTLCMLTVLSLLALLGLRHPVRLLPVLLFESAWKLTWLALVVLPRAVAGDLEPEFRQVAVTCTLVVVVLAVVPWRHVWRSYVRGPGDPWRSGAASWPRR